MNDAMHAALGKGELRARLSLEGSKPPSGTPEQLGAFIKAEHARWATAVRESGASAD